MTESKAKTLWCPLVRLNPIGATGNEYSGYTTRDHSTGNCIASQCALWRQHVASEGHRMDTGYCGLGGPD